MNINSIKTIDVSCKEWFDKVNGNSYFSAQVTLNHGMEDEVTYKIPFQYGYGDQYRHEALDKVKQITGGTYTPNWYDLKVLGIICRFNKVSAKKSEVKAFGI
jgi:hypothetical protein